MSSPTQIKAAFETVKTAAHTGAGASFAALGTAFSNNPVALIITSSFDETVWLSTDGTNNQILVPATSSFTINFGSNQQGTGYLSLPKGTQLYIKQGPDGAPSDGDIGVTAIYGR